MHRLSSADELFIRLGAVSSVVLVRADAFSLLNILPGGLYVTTEMVDGDRNITSDGEYGAA
jgi:hypothetical protein